MKLGVRSIHLACLRIHKLAVWPFENAIGILSLKKLLLFVQWGACCEIHRLRMSDEKSASPGYIFSLKVFFHFPSAFILRSIIASMLAS